MKYILSAILCLTFTSLQAETIDGVEYQLPASESVWKIASEIQNDHCTQFVYFHESNSGEPSQEFFAAHANNFPKGDFDLDAAALEKGLQVGFQGQEIQVNILEKAADSIIYEWSASHPDGQLLAFGWGRALATETGTVLLSYQSDQAKDRDNLRTIWLAVLKEAKKLD